MNRYILATLVMIGCTGADMPGTEHPYGVYSDADLEVMATASPEAAIILARRTVDDDESRHLYEQAVVLSGNPRPLEEWLLLRHGGVEYIDGELNVETAKIGYEIYLILAKFEYGHEGRRMYRQALTDAGVDLKPIKQKAGESYARMMGQ